MAHVPPSISPPSLGRNLSLNPGLLRATSTRTPATADWRSFITIEERQGIRAKVSEAYRKHCSSYEDLLNVASAIDEELLFAAAANRMDYFKTAIDFDNRVNIKRKQLSGELGVGGLERLLIRQRSLEAPVPDHGAEEDGKVLASSSSGLLPSHPCGSPSAIAPAAHSNPLFTLVAATTKGQSKRKGDGDTVVPMLSPVTSGPSSPLDTLPLTKRSRQ